MFPASKVPTTNTYLHHVQYITCLCLECVSSSKSLSQRAIDFNVQRLPEQQTREMSFSLKYLLETKKNKKFAGICQVVKVNKLYTLRTQYNIPRPTLFRFAARNVVCGSCGALPIFSVVSFT